VTEIGQKIRGRGYWRFILRPVGFDRDRVSYGDIENLVHRSVVRFRGWDFPHIDKAGLIYGSDYVGSETDWAHHVETWRFYSSGLFVHLSGMNLDWTDQSWIGRPTGLPDGPVLGVTDAIWTVTQATELAARLAVTPAGDEQMVIVTEIGGIDGRELFVDESRRAPFHQEYRARIPSYVHEQTVRRDELAAHPDEIARRAILEVFQRFGWRPNREMIREVQTELRNL
jgi:hypothetical protein